MSDTTKDAVPLKPCPFCGSEPASYKTHGVWCNNDACAIVGMIFSGGPRHWNRRAPAQVQAEAEVAAWRRPNGDLYQENPNGFTDWTPLYEHPAVQPVEQIEFPYQRTFNAIAAATSMSSSNAISISVRAFQEAYNAGAQPVEQTRALPFAWVSLVSNYCTGKESVAKRVGGLTPVYDAPVSSHGGDIAAGHFQYSETHGWQEIQRNCANNPGVVTLYHEKGWPVAPKKPSGKSIGIGEDIHWELAGRDAKKESE